MFKNLKIGVRLAILLSVTLALLVTIALFAISNLNEAKEDMHVIYSDKLVPMRLTARVQRLLDDSRAQLMLGLQHNPQSELAKLHDHPLSMHTDFINKAHADIEAAWKDIRARGEIENEKEKALLDTFEKAANEYLKEALAACRTFLPEPG